VARTILAETPPVALSEAQDSDVVKVVGAVREADRALTSPYGKTRCVHYHMQIRGASKSEKDKIRIRYRESVDFTLDVDGIDVAVRMDDAVVVTVDDIDETLSGHEDRDVMLLLLEHGCDHTARVELTEGVIALGERVAVVGRVRRQAVRDGAGGSYREPPQRFTLEAPAEHPLVVSDDPDTF